MKKSLTKKIVDNSNVDLLYFFKACGISPKDDFNSIAAPEKLPFIKFLVDSNQCVLSCPGPSKEFSRQYIVFDPFNLEKSISDPTSSKLLQLVYATFDLNHSNILRLISKNSLKVRLKPNLDSIQGLLNIQPISSFSSPSQTKKYSAPVTQDVTDDVKIAYHNIDVAIHLAAKYYDLSFFSQFFEAYNTLVHLHLEPKLSFDKAFIVFRRKVLAIQN